MRKNFSFESPIKNKVSQATFATYFVILLLFITLRMLFGFGVFNFMDQLTREIVSSVLLQVVIIFGFSVFMFSGLMRHNVKETFKYFGYKKLPTKSWIYAIVLGVIVFLLNSYIASFFSGVLSMFGYTPSGNFFDKVFEFFGFRGGSGQSGDYHVWLLFVNLFLGAVLPAICEETAHRGLLLKGGRVFGVHKAIFISGILFGLVHMNILQVFYASVIGIYLGFLALNTDSIIPGIIIHFLNNALAILFSFLSVKFPQFNHFVGNLFSISGANAIVGIIFNLCLIALLVFGLVFFSTKIIEDTSLRRVKDLQAVIYSDIAKQDYLQSLGASKQEISGQEAEKPVVIHLEEMFFDKNISLGYMTDLDKKIMTEPKPYKADILTKTCLVLSFLGGIAATIFTLVWGLI